MKKLITCLGLLGCLTASANNFKFGLPGSRGHCTAEEQAALGDGTSAADDLAAYAGPLLRAHSGANPPPKNGDLDEIEWWYGDRPEGDPAHPAGDLGPWQTRIAAIANGVAEARSCLVDKEINVLCVTADFPSCKGPVPIETPDGGMSTDEKDFTDVTIGAFSNHANLFGTEHYFLGLCPPFWGFATRGNYDTKAAFLLHEAAHLCASTVGQEGAETYGLLECHDLARKDPQAAVRNAPNLQYLVGGLDNRRQGGPGSAAIVPAIQMVLDSTGCDVTRGQGRRSTIILLGFIGIWLLAFAYRRQLR